MRLFHLHKFQILKGIYYFSVFFLASGFSYVAFADPPGSAYAPGATLDPSCAPGTANCTVSSTATASGSDGYLQFNTSGSLASDSGIFWDNTNKRLGVGSSTPSAPLTVVGQVLAGYFTGTTTATSTFGGNLAINGTGTSTSNGGFDITAGCYAINGTCVGAGASTNSAGGTGAIQFANGTAFAGDATNFFWDDSTNRLGIGTSTPAYSLDVNGDANIAAGSAYRYNGASIATASTTLNNYFFGNAGNLTMTGNLNTAAGGGALGWNTTGTQNTATGYLSLTNNSTGTHNAAFGTYTMISNTTGWFNTAVGTEALYSNSTGNQNTAVGGNALHENTTGDYNTALGINSLYSNITGFGNVGLGYHALQDATSTEYNTAIGYESGYGSLADHRSVIDTYATFLGYRSSRDSAVASTTALTNITAIGYNAKVGASNSMVLGGVGADAVKVGIGTTTPSFTLDVNGDANIAAGSAYKYNGYNIAMASTTINNYFFGASGNLTMSGGWNTAASANSLRFNSTGEGNVAMGTSALWTNSTGSYNAAFGRSALYSNVSGSNNTAVGDGAMSGNTASNNTAVGSGGLASLTTGTGNTSLGVYAGGGNWASPRDQFSVIDNNATFLGYYASRDSSVASTTALTNITAIGYNAKVGASNSMVLGGVGADAVKVGIGTTTPSFTLDVNGDANIAAGSAYKYNGVNLATASTTLNNYFFGGAGNLTMTGNANTGSGYQSLLSNITGSGNVALGYQSLYTSTSTSNNTAVGYQSLYANISGTENTAFGYRSLYSNTTGVQNVAMGHQSLGANTTGYNNTAQGTFSLNSNTTGAGNTAVGTQALTTNTTGNDNTAIGLWALMYNTSGEGNVAIGRSALSANTDGVANTATGYSALGANTSGNENLASGAGALQNSTTGSFNVAVGRSALSANISGNNNVALGYQSLYASTSTDSLTAVGWRALYANTSGIWNTAIGESVLMTNTTGNYNTGVGAGSLENNTTGNNNTAFGAAALTSNTDGINNVGVGYRALRVNTTGDFNVANGSLALVANISGSGNTALGYQALTTSTSTSNNTAIGYQSLYANTSGTQNTANGNEALRYNTTGSYNDAFGASALRGNTSGQINTALGGNAMFSNTSGSFNTAVGRDSLYANTTGTYNVALGLAAFGANTTGASNVGVGYRAGYGDTDDHRSVIDNFATFIGRYASRSDAIASTTALTNITAIGYNAKVGASNSMVLGGTGADAVNVGIGTTTPSFTLDVNGDANIAAGSAYKYNGANIAMASTTLNNYFFGGAGNLTMTGDANTGSGHRSLSSNSTGYNNTAQGYYSLYGNTTGAGNIAFGTSALATNSTGDDNTAVGLWAMLFNASGSNNTAVGRSSLYSNIDGGENIAVGYSSLYSNTSGSANVANGSRALLENTLGSYNTAVGYEAGYGSLEDNRSVTDAYATFLGYRSSRDASVASTTALTNITAIGYNAKVGASNSMVLGGTGADAVKVGVGTTTPVHTLNVEQAGAGVVARFTNSSGYCDIDPTNTALVCTSDATLKKNVTTVGGALSAITSLRGVNFKWLNEDDSTHTHLGVIAQEVEQILPELVATDTLTGKKSVNYIGFVPVLIEAVKELASRVSNLEARIAQGVSDGISNISDFVVETLTAKKVVTETLEMKDSATGETYCVKIANGEWDKTKGACASAPASTQTASVIEAVIPPLEGETASSTPEPDLPPVESQQDPIPTEQTPAEEIVPDPQPEVPPEESQEAPAPEPTPTEE